MYHHVREIVRAMFDSLKKPKLIAANCYKLFKNNKNEKPKLLPEIFYEPAFLLSFVYLSNIFFFGFWIFKFLKLYTKNLNALLWISFLVKFILFVEQHIKCFKFSSFFLYRKPPKTIISMQVPCRRHHHLSDNSF